MQEVGFVKNKTCESKKKEEEKEKKMGMIKCISHNEKNVKKGDERQLGISQTD